MSRRDVGGRSRTEISGDVQESDEQMQEHLCELEKGDADVQTVRDTLGAMEFGGTSDGNDAVRAALDESEAVGIHVFDEKDGCLDELQGENEDMQEGINEQTDADEKDEQGVSEAGRRIAFEETIKALDDVKMQLNQDIEFLKSQVEKAMKSVADSEAKQQEYRGSVHSNS